MKKIYTAEEIWNGIPDNDVNDEAHKRQWAKVSTAPTKINNSLWCSEHGDQEGNVCKKCIENSGTPTNTTKEYNPIDTVGLIDSRKNRSYNRTLRRNKE